MIKIRWSNIFEQAIGAIIAAAVIASSVYFYNVFTGKAQASLWLWVGTTVFFISIAVALIWNAFRAILKAIGKWIISNWQLISAIFLFLIALCGIYILGGNIWWVIIALDLIIATILLAKYRPKSKISQDSLEQIIQSQSSIFQNTQDRFVEKFENGLENWKYAGDWRLVPGDGKKVLFVSNSGRGGFAIPCLLWENYIFEFETRIEQHSTSWVIRAKDPNNHVMLQCQQASIYPHYLENNHYTKKKGIDLPTKLPLKTWFGVQIKVKGIRGIVINLKIYGKVYSILPERNPLLKVPSYAPIKYSIGSVGFRAGSTEGSCFRNISVTKI